MIEQTLVLVKPDGVQRGLIGEVIKRFEQRGLKVVALKLTKIDKDFSKKHYTEDIERRRGKKVRDLLIDYITSEPVVAIIVEGVDAIENVRKIAGETESKAAIPGTIRGDFSHVSFSHADENKIAAKNIVHTSANKEEAKAETSLWFSVDELHSYKRVEEDQVF
ncbi:nucleoside-diphosphate kinase [Candidatus Pacearchaeota archaeon]|nr:nucleoside-diphosphate kinase [Candidatus Pacearchaeota archaeon]